MNRMKYKALMLDLDGTTIPNSKTGMPSVRVVNARPHFGIKLVTVR